MNYEMIKKLVFSMLLICGVAVGSGNAFAVTGKIKITGLDANQHFSIPDLGVSGEADENGEFVTDLACNPDDDEDKTSSGQTTDSSGKPVMLLCLPHSSWLARNGFTVVGLGAGVLTGVLLGNNEEPGTTTATGLYPHTGTCGGGCGWTSYSVTCTPATGPVTSCTWTMGTGTPVTITCSSSGAGGSCPLTTGFFPPGTTGVHSCSTSWTGSAEPTGGFSLFCEGGTPFGTCSDTCP